MSLTQYTDLDDVIVKGDDGSSTGQRIAAVGTSLSVTTAAGSIVTPTTTWGSILWQPMNAATGGVAFETSIGTTFTTIYSRSGSGKVIGFSVTLETAFNDWFIRVLVDGVDLFFDSAGIPLGDLENSNIYGYAQGTFSGFQLGFNLRGIVLFFEAPHNKQIKYNSSFSIQIRKAGGTKKYRGGLITWEA